MSTDYFTLSHFKVDLPKWVSTDDSWRLAAYKLYENLYWSELPDLKITRTSTEDMVYLPTARTIVEATNRYVAPDFAVSITNGRGGEPTSDVAAAKLILSDLFKRERFKSKFSGAKRYCLIQGDWVWHVRANPHKPQGSRISIDALDPSLYFPQYSEDTDRLIAVHLAEPLQVDNRTQVRRQTYRKVFQDDNETKDVVGITVEEAMFEMDGWWKLDASPLKVLRDVERLPSGITSIPVYHIRNFDNGQSTANFGYSELRGLEQLVARINQTITDEDLSLALQGIGMYVTTSDQPVDPVTKLPVPWRLGPGRVQQIGHDDKFERVQGVTSVEAFGDHYNRLWQNLKHGSSTPDVAIGEIEVRAAESGVALALKMAPILAKGKEKDQLIIDPHNQMLYDIFNAWYPAYESTSFQGIDIECIVGDAVPVDRAARFSELNDMLDRQVIDSQYYRDECEKLGYVFPEDIQERVAAEREAKKDDFTLRLNRESGSSDVVVPEDE